MRIISIDNCYGDDGLVNLQSALFNLNSQSEEKILAIIPEYDGDRLNRLDILIRKSTDVLFDERGLIHNISVIISSLQAKREAAYKKSNESVITVRELNK